MAVVNEVKPLAGTTHLIHIISESLIGGVDRHNGLQMRWPLAGKLEGIEAAV